jgi:hypothetical protein
VVQEDLAMNPRERPSLKTLAVAMGSLDRTESIQKVKGIWGKRVDVSS